MDDRPRESLDEEVVQPSELIRRWWPVLVVALLVGAVAGVGYTEQRPAVYETVVVVLVGPVVPDAAILQGTAEVARTYGEIAESRAVIEGAAAGLDLDPAEVTVRAVAGRDSSTVEMRVRSPSRSATPQVAGAIVDNLQDLVAANQSTVALGAATEDDEDDAPPPEPGAAGAFALGSVLTVIDDGGGRAREVSLDPSLAGAIGGVAGLFLAGAGALATETRRMARPWSHAVDRATGHALGALHSVPVVWRILRGSRAIATDAKARHEAGLVVDQLLREGHSEDDRFLIFLTAPSRDGAYLRAVAQLAAGFDRPPTVLDPDGLLSDHHLPPGERVVPGEPHDLVAGDRVLARVVVPAAPTEPAVASVLEARARCGDLTRPGDTVIVFSVAEHRSPSWRHWAGASDHAVVLARRRHLGGGVLGPFVTRVVGCQPSLLGGAFVRRRWLRGAARRIRLVVATSTTAGDDPPEASITASDPVPVE